jgi:predicted P-loop ATPase|nr:MAG TPA: virulence associated protein E [Caudoviricetes sp.]
MSVLSPSTTTVAADIRTEKRFPVEFAQGTSANTTALQYSLDDFLDMLRSPGTQKNARSYLPGELRGHHRSGDNVIGRSVITLDLDGASAEGFTELLSYLDDVAVLWHTTFSHSPQKPSYRVLIPLDGMVTPDVYTRIVREIMRAVPQAAIDAASATPSQIMFTPAAKDESLYEYGSELNRPLASGALFQSAPDSPEGVVSLGRVRKKDPLTLKGIAGEFCKHYQDLDELIEVFKLPYERVGSRFRYIHADKSSAPGMSPLPDAPLLYFSNHGSDPASGRAQNAFDLVRIHKFGALDAGYEGAVIHSPSSLAMKNFLATHEGFRQRRADAAYDNVARPDAASIPLTASEDVSTLTQEPEPAQESEEDEEQGSGSLDWTSQLIRHEKTLQVEDRIENYDLIFMNDPIFKSLWWNVRGDYEAIMGEDYDLRDGSPPQVNNADVSGLKDHIERQYQIRRVTRQRVDDLLGRVRRERRIDPVKKYLQSLTWDGIPRLETCLPGAEDTPYNRMVAKRALLGAVARAFKPGCKVDQSLILFGGQGVGKTTWIERMARGYTASLGDIQNKDTLISASRSWIMVSDEGHALNNADFNELKDFLTRQRDVYRLPYDRSATEVPRRWVVWGTTNDPMMLRERDGNRRFLIVDVLEQMDFDKYTPEYVDQVWAEAVALYQDGERPVLSPAEEVLAEQARKSHTMEDNLVATITEALESPVPVAWERMSLPERIQWLQDESMGMENKSVPTASRSFITPAAVWVEIMRKGLPDMSLRDQNRITAALVSLTRKGVLVQEEGRQRVGCYGSQTVFRVTYAD